jgi:hypothetical protein
MEFVSDLNLRPWDRSLVPWTGDYRLVSPKSCFLLMASHHFLNASDRLLIASDQLLIASGPTLGGFVKVAR